MGMSSDYEDALLNDEFHRLYVCLVAQLQHVLTYRLVAEVQHIHSSVELSSSDQLAQTVKQAPLRPGEGIVRCELNCSVCRVGLEGMESTADFPQSDHRDGHRNAIRWTTVKWRLHHPIVEEVVVIVGIVASRCALGDRPQGSQIVRIGHVRAWAIAPQLRVIRK